MAKYRLKDGAGKHRMRVGGEARLVRADEIVELTEAQFRACKDKFVAADAVKEGPSSAELRAQADAKEKEEQAQEEAAKAAAKAAAIAEAKAAERAADAAKAEADRAAKAKVGTGTKG